jgi:two-component system, sensor histidine kinase PdtaS
MMECSAKCANILVLALLPFPFLLIGVAFYALRLRAALFLKKEKGKEREIRLNTMRVSHDALTREFHHRVKNSLQIIQSYLALSRRQKPAPHNIHLAEAEVKVQVISTAYRLALSQGVMNPIALRGFLQEVVDNVQAVLCGTFTTISLIVEPESHIVLDRAIPIGLAMVEAVIAALGVASIMKINVLVQAVEAGKVALIIRVDENSSDVLLPLRLMSGLQSQLGAQDCPCLDHEILSWRFSD